MKCWIGFGSEHSMNLVMIGKFQEASDASDAKRLIEELISLISNEQASGRIEAGEPQDRFPESVLEFLMEKGFLNIAPSELEQFMYDVQVERSGNTIKVSTDECDVSAFLKALLNHKAHVEVFSAHHHKKEKSVID